MLRHINDSPDGLAIGHGFYFVFGLIKMEYTTTTVHQSNAKQLVPSLDGTYLENDWIDFDFCGETRKTGSAAGRPAQPENRVPSAIGM